MKFSPARLPCFGMGGPIGGHVITTAIDFINVILWNYVLIFGLLSAGLFFTIKLGGIQFFHFGEMLRVLTASPDKNSGDGITPLQALAVSLASRVGTGNLAGVAVALTLGGPGAIFWMWMVALVGMATAYAESTLAQVYKVRLPGGGYRGGPAFYIAEGLKAPWAGAIFSVCLIVSFGLIFVAVQSNSIAEAFRGAFGVPKVVVGGGTAALAAIVILGGIKSIAKVAQILVPVMAGAYLLVAIVVMVLNYSTVPEMLWLIISSAFGLNEAVGGVTGGVMAAALNGIKRGLFSNEAGMGSAPNIAAVATPVPHHPASQGFVQAFGCFVDTILVSTATALLILLSGVLGVDDATGMQLTQNALEVHMGPSGAYFVALAILFFGFTSILGNYSYAENAMTYLGMDSPLPINILRAACLSFVVWGAVQSVQTVFNFADASMGVMAVINLTAILLLSGTVYKLTRDYFEQRKAGKEPRFVAHKFPELDRGVDAGIWTKSTG